MPGLKAWMTKEDESLRDARVNQIQKINTDFIQRAEELITKYKETYPYLGQSKWKSHISRSTSRTRKRTLPPPPILLPPPPQ
jgi:two-component SAPR family response regulator